MNTASKYDRSAILGYAWTRARAAAAAAAGESVRLHIGAAMRAAWSEAKAVAAAAMVPQPAQQQQANAGLPGAGACEVCGRPLTAPVSIEAGIGPVCRSHGHARRQLSIFDNRSDYRVELAGDVICVTDLNLGGRSVTNDAEGVIRDLAEAGYDLARMPVIYRDSQRNWDELVVKDGVFAGFRHLDTARKEALRAIAKGLDVPPPEMVEQPCQQHQACAAQEEAAAPAAEPEEVEVVQYGRAVFTRGGDRITFRGQVTGGGAAGPGHVAAYRAYGDSVPVRMFQDNRSGSQRSGSCTWRLEPDTVYWISNVAMDSRRSGAVGLSTFDGGLRILGVDACEAERRRVWPLQAEAHDDAQARRREDEARRIEAERALAEERRVAREALAEMNAEAAARIKAEGQPRVADLPKLTGTAKQVAYALQIRDAVRARQPDLPELRTQRASRYWIENHRRALR